MEENWFMFFYDIWKDAVHNYQKAVKEARALLFSNLILSNHSNPRILFKVLDSVRSPTHSYFTDASQELCEKFSNFLKRKLIILVNK